jgi:hypothetical protein
MKKLLLLLILVVAILTLPTPGSAQTDESNNENPSAKRREIRQRLEERQQERQDRIASKAAQIKQRLTEVKLRVCQTKQDNIKRRSSNLAERANRHFDIFESIAKRVDDYYNNTLVPKGVVVEDYEELKEDIENQKADVQEAIEAAKAVAENFDCSGDNPKGQLDEFRAEMQHVIEALKDYRTTIKDFIVAIKTAAGANNGATDSAGN